MKNSFLYLPLLSGIIFSMSSFALDGKKPIEIDKACIQLNKYDHPVATVVSKKTPKIGYFTPCFDEEGLLRSFENKGVLKPDQTPSQEFYNTIYEHTAEELINKDGAWVAKDKKDRKILFMKGINFSFETGGRIQLNALKNGLTDSRRYRDIIVRKNEENEWQMIDPVDGEIVNHLFIDVGTFGVDDIVPFYMERNERISNEELDKIVSARQEVIKQAKKERSELLKELKKVK